MHKHKELLHCSDMQAYFAARRELHDLMTMAEQEFEVTEPTPEMDVLLVIIQT